MPGSGNVSGWDYTGEDDKSLPFRCLRVQWRRQKMIIQAIAYTRL